MKDERFIVKLLKVFGYAFAIVFGLLAASFAIVFIMWYIVDFFG